MHLLHVIRSVDPTHGGPGEGLRHLVQAGLSLGHRHEVLTVDAPDAPWVRAFPGVIHGVGPVDTTYGYTPALSRWLDARAAGYDALVVHGLWQYHGLAVRRAARAHGRPYFVYPHGMLDPWFARRYPLKHLKKRLYWLGFDYRVTRDARALLFTADEERRLASRSFAPYRVREAVIGYGLQLPAEAAQAGSDAFRAAFALSEEARLLLFLGRLHEKKGCDLLLEAFARVAAREPTLHLVMAGPDGGGLQRRLRERAERLGVARRVVWTGLLQGRLKWSALRAAEVFALPSHQENFGLAVAEALAMGLPVLISDKVNIWREIDAAGAGMVDSDDASGTLRLLERWLALPRARRIACAERARECYARHFQAEGAAERLAHTIGALSRA